MFMRSDFKNTTGQIIQFPGKGQTGEGGGEAVFSTPLPTDGTEMRGFIREEMAAEAEQQMQDLHAMLEDRYGPAIAQGIMDKMGKIGS
jgi:hypothetical protein